jgi:hypothetical protein
MENLSGLTIFDNDRHACTQKSSHSERRVRSVTTDGRHIFAANEAGCRIVKIGTGYGGSVKGFVYAETQTCDVGFAAATEELLIHRPLSFDESGDGRLCRVLDKNSLEEIEILNFPAEMELGMVI